MKEDKNNISQKELEELEKINKINTEDKPKKSILSKILFIIGFIFTAAFMVWINQAISPDTTTLITMLIISVLVNILIVMLLFGTWVGVDVLTRFFNRFKYKSGRYVNALHLMKSGVLRERFVKKDPENGSIKMLGLKYVCNSRLLFNFKGIPSYFYIEGCPKPVNIWEEDLANEISCAEVDTVMNSVQAFDFKQWLEKNKMLFLFGLMVIVGSALISLFFGYQVYEMLRDGTFKMAQVTCKNLPPVTEILPNTLGGS